MRPPSDTRPVQPIRANDPESVVAVVTAGSWVAGNRRLGSVAQRAARSGTRGRATTIDKTGRDEHPFPSPVRP
jgi:hypothetical protein